MYNWLAAEQQKILSLKPVYEIKDVERSSTKVSVEFMVSGSSPPSCDICERVAVEIQAISINSYGNTTAL